MKRESAYEYISWRFYNLSIRLGESNLPVDVVV